MGICSCLPKIDRCCWCTRNLKFATICIICWSWFAATHEIAMVIHPACTSQYLTVPLGKVLKVYKWLLFIANAAVLFGGFAFLIGIFKNKATMGVIFIICGLVVAIFSLFFAILGLCTSCKNFNDFFMFIIYAIMWGYFLLIINTYNQSVEDNKSIAPG